MSDETEATRKKFNFDEPKKEGAARKIGKLMVKGMEPKKSSMFDMVKKAGHHEKSSPAELRFKKLMDIGLGEKGSDGKVVTLADGTTPVKLEKEDKTAFKAFYKQVYSQKGSEAKEQKARVDEWVTKVVEYRAAGSKDVHAMADGYMKAKDEFTARYETVMEKGAISSLADGYADIINKQTKGEVNREVGFIEYAKVASAQLVAEDFKENNKLNTEQVVRAKKVISRSIEIDNPVERGIADVNARLGYYTAQPVAHALRLAGKEKAAQAYEQGADTAVREARKMGRALPLVGGVGGAGEIIAGGITETLVAAGSVLPAIGEGLGYGAIAAGAVVIGAGVAAGVGLKTLYDKGLTTEQMKAGASAVLTAITPGEKVKGSLKATAYTLAEAPAAVLMFSHAARYFMGKALREVVSNGKSAIHGLANMREDRHDKKDLTKAHKDLDKSADRFDLVIKDVQAFAEKEGIGKELAAMQKYVDTLKGYEKHNEEYMKGADKRQAEKDKLSAQPKPLMEKDGKRLQNLLEEDTLHLARQEEAIILRKKAATLQDNLDGRLNKKGNRDLADKISHATHDLLDATQKLNEVVTAISHNVVTRSQDARVENNKNAKEDQQKWSEGVSKYYADVMKPLWENAVAVMPEMKALGLTQERKEQAAKEASLSKSEREYLTRTTEGGKYTSEDINRLKGSHDSKGHSSKATEFELATAGLEAANKRYNITAEDLISAARKEGVKGDEELIDFAEQVSSNRQNDPDVKIAMSRMKAAKSVEDLATGDKKPSKKLSPAEELAIAEEKHRDAAIALKKAIKEKDNQAFSIASENKYAAEQTLKTIRGEIDSVKINSGTKEAKALESKQHRQEALANIGSTMAAPFKAAGKMVGSMMHRNPGMPAEAIDMSESFGISSMGLPQDSQKGSSLRVRTDSLDSESAPLAAGSGGISPDAGKWHLPKLSNPFKGSPNKSTVVLDESLGILATSEIDARDSKLSPKLSRSVSSNSLTDSKSRSSSPSNSLRGESPRSVDGLDSPTKEYTPHGGLHIRDTAHAALEAVRHLGKGSVVVDKKGDGSNSLPPPLVRSSSKGRI